MNKKQPIIMSWWIAVSYIFYCRFKGKESHFGTIVLFMTTYYKTLLAVKAELSLFSTIYMSVYNHSKLHVFKIYRGTKITL